MNYSSIPYQALDSNGREYDRFARVIGELPVSDRLIACREVATTIAKLIGQEAPDSISFGTPAYQAFGMTSAEAKNHEYAEILLKSGDDMPLIYCH
ncbi:hypothetical protein R6242_21590 [Iodobacter sp. CM08]|uniref:hypothetical protein n=1 Tax=Iodobacter sp. CM08 TaxID=3085902 RepID=UPI0029824AFD|nr:hypothetical protein [Iodobacter sp. CM08]MDW5419171.1 hypothetical protein [Iodobacter sp. CM08]